VETKCLFGKKAVVVYCSRRPVGRVPEAGTCARVRSDMMRRLVGLLFPLGITSFAGRRIKRRGMGIG
jgi:hypothetical protein